MIKLNSLRHNEDLTSNENELSLTICRRANEPNPREAERR
jgi:hypothetical protein